MAAVLALVVGGLWFITGHKPYGEGSGDDKLATARKGPSELEPGKDADAGAAAEVRRELSPEEKLIAAADFEQKLRAGMGTSAVHTHRFDNETVRLQVTVRNEAERDAAAARLLAYLTERRVADLGNVISDERAPDSSFYYQGKEGVNFAEGDERQFLLRAAPSELDGLMGELAQGATRRESLGLVAGPVTISGFERIRTALHGFSKPVPAASPETGSGAGGDNRVASDADLIAEGSRTSDEATADGEGPFEGLLPFFGLDLQTLLQAAGPADEAEDMSVLTDASGKEESAGWAHMERPSLVERRAEKLAGSQRGRVSAVAAPEGPDETRPAVVSESGTADVALMGEVVAAQLPRAFVTLVVEVTIAKPDARRPSSRSEPSSDSRHKKSGTPHSANE
jgi:hypothetical protein